MQPDLGGEAFDQGDSRIDTVVDLEVRDGVLDLQVTTTQEGDVWREEEDKIVLRSPRNLMSPYTGEKLIACDDNLDGNHTDRETDWSTQDDEGISYIYCDGGEEGEACYDDDDLYDEHSVDQMAMALHHQQQQLIQCRLELQFERHKREAVEQDVELLSAVTRQLEFDFYNVSRERDFWKQQGAVQRETVKHLSSHILRLEELLDEKDMSQEPQLLIQQEHEQDDSCSVPETQPKIEKRHGHRHHKSRRRDKLIKTSKHSKGSKEKIGSDNQSHQDKHRRDDDMEERFVKLEGMFMKLLQRLDSDKKTVAVGEEPTTPDTTRLIDIDDSMLLFDDFENDQTVAAAAAAAPVIIEKILVPDDSESNLEPPQPNEIEYDDDKEEQQTTTSSSSNVVSIHSSRQASKVTIPQKQQSVMDSSSLRHLPKDIETLLDDILQF